MANLVTLSCVVLMLAVSGRTQRPVEDWKYWFGEAETELKKALHTTHNYNTAKNIIVFIGDGMGVSTITAARIYKGQMKKNNGEEEKLNFEKFPHVALSKTYNTDRQVADSAGTATAYWCGFKSNYGTLGTDAGVKRGDCAASLDPQHRRSCVLEWAQQHGKLTGIVTNTRITHATPAALYAKSADRDWECDGKLGTSQCSDIGKQLVNDLPGSNVNVIFGGGRQMLISNISSTRHAPEKIGTCARKDGQDLTKVWLSQKLAKKRQASLVFNRQELNSLDLEKTQDVLGLFSNSHMSYEDERDKNEQPSLSEMVEKAISLLKKGDKGFFLAVEGGRIDHAHHNTQATRSLHETVSFDEAVQTAVNMTSSEDTLIVVTADHSHTLTIQGYPERGADISGAFEKSDVDHQTYTTLMYSNGPNFNYTWNGTHVVRPSLAAVDTSMWDYHTPVGIPSKYETHGGEDVAIFASGPWSHLFHGVHEQNYIPHVLAYAAKIGPQANRANPVLAVIRPRPSSSRSHAHTVSPVLSSLVMLSLTTVLLLLN